MAYIEPAPIKDRENPLESMMERFNIAAEKLGLSDEVYNVLKKPSQASDRFATHHDGQWKNPSF